MPFNSSSSFGILYPSFNAFRRFFLLKSRITKVCMSVQSPSLSTTCPLRFFIGNLCVATLCVIQICLSAKLSLVARVHSPSISSQITAMTSSDVNLTCLHFSDSNEFRDCRILHYHISRLNSCLFHLNLEGSIWLARASKRPLSNSRL